MTDSRVQQRHDMPQQPDDDDDIAASSTMAAEGGHDTANCSPKTTILQQWPNNKHEDGCTSYKRQ
jgi:hypothetical protein